MMMGSNDGENVLHVRMFGGFSMSWNGRLVTGDSRSSETQFAYLMQLLLHHREDGVSRVNLEQVLFEGRDINDLHHAARSVIYNAKKKLKKAGLPDVNYIERRKDVYYWTDQIPVVIDTVEMERLSSEAKSEEDPEKKLQLYLDACHQYTGEFLGTQTAVWAAQEARRYRVLFCDCVEQAVQSMRRRHDYFRMEELGIYAAKVNPLADWEIVTMEALISTGRYADAEKLYEDTVDLYLQEQGLRPSPRLMELLNKLGGQMGRQYAVLDDIQMELAEADSMRQGGYVCSYPVFQGIYRMITRLIERGGQSVYLMLCIVVDSKGNPMKAGPMLEDLSQRLGDAIQHSVRHGDVVNRYGKGQYLVLLVNITRENCSILQRRINYHFLVGRQRTGIQYHVNSVICTADGQTSI